MEIPSEADKVWLHTGVIVCGCNIQSIVIHLMMYRLSLKTGLHIEDFDNQKNKCDDNR